MSHDDGFFCSIDRVHIIGTDVAQMLDSCLDPVVLVYAFLFYYF